MQLNHLIKLLQYQQAEGRGDWNVRVNINGTKSNVETFKLESRQLTTTGEIVICDTQYRSDEDVTTEDRRHLRSGTSANRRIDTAWAKFDVENRNEYQP